MLLIRKLQKALMIPVFIYVGLLLMVSNSMAQNGTWKIKADIPTARLFLSSCELDGKIYVIGGAKDLNSSLSTMEVYDPATDTWNTTKTDMPTARAELCVAAVNGKIYAIGGALSHSGGAVIYGIVEEYDPATDSWDTGKQPMPTPRKGIACGVIDNKIYVAGGAASSGFTPLNVLEVYDPAADSWTSKASMPAARYYPCGAVLMDTFYVSGGLIGSPWTGQTAVQKYDPTTDHWEYGTNLMNGRVGHTTDVIKDRIYAIGGDKQSPVIKEVEEYDPQTETWTEIDQIPSVMISHTSSVYGNKIYLFGGSTTNINNVTLTYYVRSYTPELVSTSESQKYQSPGSFVKHHVYPNPTNDLLNIETGCPGHYSINITSLSGQLISSYEMEETTYQIDLSSFRKGVYLITVRSRDFVTTRKLIKL